jgi:hypothetical protein
MSATEMLQPGSASAQHQNILQDYRIFHTGPEKDQKSQQKNMRSSTVTTRQNPPGWSTDHRRVPHHRPINYNLDRAYISQAQNTVEYVFIHILFHGVNINAVSYLPLWESF